MAVKSGMKINGESKATTFPANMGLLAPVESTEMLPNSFEAVTSHAMREQQSPSGGVRVAAHLFWPDHIKVRVAGSTAEEMMTPMRR